MVFVACEKYFTNNYSNGNDFFFTIRGSRNEKQRGGGGGGNLLCFLSLPPVE